MKVIRRCLKTGSINAREIAVTRQQLAAWNMGADLAKLAPDLTEEEVKFIDTGEYPEKWMQEFSEN